MSRLTLFAARTAGASVKTARIPHPAAALASFAWLLPSLLLTTAGLGTAVAAERELSLELGHLDNPDPDYDLFDDNGGMSSQGLRAGYHVHERVALVAGWHRVHRGAEVSIGSSGQNTFVAAFSANVWTLGLKAGFDITDSVSPYVLVSAMGLQARARFDDDPEDSSNAGQVSSRAFAPGGQAVAGADVALLRSRSTGRAIVWHAEMGYGYVATLDFDNVGDMSPRGFAARTGIGLRF